MAAGEIADRFDVSKPTMSGHFNVLKDAGLVQAERDGTTIRYRLNASVLEEAAAAILDLLETGRGKEAGEDRR
jgi:DNA-binding transcriptional ArsR family regulator